MMMASFIPYHGKKRDRLEKKEDDLRRLIARGVGQEKLLKAASEIREGRIRVLRAGQNQNPESNAELRAAFLALSDRIEALKALSDEAVLATYLPSAKG